MFFAPGTAASAAAAPSGPGGLPADVAELAAALGRPSRAAGVVAVELAANTDFEPVRRGHRCVSRRAHVPADVARANPFKPRPAGVAIRH